MSATYVRPRRPEFELCAVVRHRVDRWMDLKVVLGSLGRAFVGRFAVGWGIAELFGKTAKTDM